MTNEEKAIEAEHCISGMEQELINLLKENLRIEVSHPEHDVGYFEHCYEPDMENITVAVYYKDELICESTSY